MAAVVLACIGLTAIIAAHATGLDLGRAMAALWRGSFGSWYAITSATLVRATPLMLAGLAVAVAFRAGVFNIGVEGQLLAGAAATTAIGVTAPPQLGHLTLLLALLAGIAAGASWAYIAAALRSHFHVLEVISTIMLNFVATYAVSYLVRGPLQEHRHIFPQTEILPQSARMPVLLPGSRLHVGFLVAIAAGAGVRWALRQTAWGFRVRAAGASPDAARVAGRIDVPTVTTAAFLVSGGLAGLAGAVEVTGVTYAIYENLSPGYGYTAIAVALVAKLNALGVIGAAILFGALDAGAASMQREAGVPSVVAMVIQAAIVLALLAAGTVRIGAAGLRSATPARERMPS